MANIQPHDLIPAFQFVGTEKDIEAHIVDNIEDISLRCGWGGVKKFKAQLTIRGKSTHYRPDLMIWHPDGSGTVIEVKSTTKSKQLLLSSVSQILQYGLIIEKTLGAMPRLVIAANEISEDVYDCIKAYRLPINMLMVDGDRCIYLT
jgi:hypothetical protein